MEQTTDNNAIIEHNKGGGELNMYVFLSQYTDVVIIMNIEYTFKNNRMVELLKDQYQN